MVWNVWLVFSFFFLERLTDGRGVPLDSLREGGECNLARDITSNNSTDGLDRAGDGASGQGKETEKGGLHFEK